MMEFISIRMQMQMHRDIILHLSKMGYQQPKRLCLLVVKGSLACSLGILQVIAILMRIIKIRCFSRINRWGQINSR